MTHVSLFTGIGGLDLAAEWAGFETVLQVEREPFALQVLENHWPDVPRITDVREVTSGAITGPVTVVSGGFPCQPFSAAGKRRGTDDDRYLWPELLRIVEELRPTWVVGENVSGLLSIDEGMEIDRMLASLETRDYTPWVLHYPAAGVGASHRRDRVFIVAYSQSKRNNEQGHEQFQSRKIQVSVGRSYSNMAHAGSVRCVWSKEPENEQQSRIAGSFASSKWRGTESSMGGMVDGLSSWMDGEPDGLPRVATGVKDKAARLKALGNAVVPAQAYPIFAAIAATEEACE